MVIGLNCYFILDKSTVGGALSIVNSGFYITNTFIQNCGAFKLAGGIFVSDCSGYLSLFKDSEISNCWCHEIGGGMMVSSSILNIESSKFLSNTAGHSAGGLYLSSSSLMIYETKFGSNQCGNYTGSNIRNSTSSFLKMEKQLLRFKGGGAITVYHQYNNNDGLITYKCCFSNNSVFNSDTNLTFDNEPADGIDIIFAGNSQWKSHYDTFLSPRLSVSVGYSNKLNDAFFFIKRIFNPRVNNVNESHFLGDNAFYPFSECSGTLISSLPKTNTLGTRPPNNISHYSSYSLSTFSIHSNYPTEKYIETISITPKIGATIKQTRMSSQSQHDSRTVPPVYPKISDTPYPTLTENIMQQNSSFFKILIIICLFISFMLLIIFFYKKFNKKNNEESTQFQTFIL